MNNYIPTLPKAFNEPVKSYQPGSLERIELKRELNRQLEKCMSIPLIINGESIYTSEQKKMTCPHDHHHVLANISNADRLHVDQAIKAALDAKKDWKAIPWQERALIFLKAAELISKKYTYLLNGATMLGQSKNAFQAEIDATCELVDFLRFNVKFMEKIYQDQPDSEPGVWNRMEYRPLEGFVFALTPFNFTAIAGNLSVVPALMGNTVVWKPASTAVLSGFYFMQILKEAGLPDGVINFIPGKGSMIADIVLSHKDLAGINFTGSTTVFQALWKTVGNNIESYRSYPRLVGETGGKDYIFMHPTADIDAVVTAAIRGAFEYQGQKCSACSRLYLPRSRWSEFEKKAIQQIKEIHTGSVVHFKNFVNAVIDDAAFEKVSGYIERAKKSDKASVLVGGNMDKSIGYYIEPTLIVTTDPFYESMTQEIFGPVLSIYIYEDDLLDKTLEIVDKTSQYALTGAIFATDRRAIDTMTRKLTHSAGNFYINDKPTGAVVGQQPFGGARGSGTNDKAGSYLNLLRWTSARTIKETFNPPLDFRYPFMAD